MTLVLTFLAAAIASIVWYAAGPQNHMKIGALALMYWGAAIMWCVDGINNLIEGEGFIEIVEAETMIDDAILGLTVIVLGLVAWSIYLFIKDPKRTIRQSLRRTK